MTEKPSRLRTPFGAKTETLLGERKGGDRALRLSDMNELLPGLIMQVMRGSSGGAMPPDGTYGDISIAGSVWTVEPDVIALNDLSDVVTSAPAAGEVVRFNGTEFVNSFISLRVPLATRLAAGSATLDFTEFNNSVFRLYEYDLENLLPTADDAALLFRTSTNGGVSFDNTSGEYHWSVRGMNGTATFDSGSGAAGSVVLTGNTAGARPGNAAGEYGVSGLIRLLNAGNTSSPTDVQGQLSFFNTAGAYSSYTVAGVRVAATDVDAARFLFNFTTVASGAVHMFGLV